MTDLTIPSDACNASIVPHGVEWALYAASLGNEVFPIRPGTKVPYSREDTGPALGINLSEKAGVYHARSDEASIRALWSGNRSDALIGVAMGRGRMALDQDEKNGKSGSATMIANGWTIPPTSTQRTPSGGYHYLFTTPAEIVTPNDASELGEGLDRRSDGGYIVLYDPAILTEAVASAPEWSLTNIKPSSLSRYSPLGTLMQSPSWEWLDYTLRFNEPNELSRDEWRALYWASMQSGWSLDPTEEKVFLKSRLDAWCDCYTVKHNDQRENDNLWREGLKNGTRTGWLHLEHSLPQHQQAILQRYRASRFLTPIHNEQLPTTGLFIRAADMQHREPEYHIAGLIETDALALLFGDPGSGKSFIALDMACCVATGHAFHGHPATQGTVFYIAGEGHNGLRRRMSAWEARTGATLANAPLFVSRVAVQLLTPDSAGAVRDAALAMERENGAARLIVVDTLARNFGPGDENSQKDMGSFIAALDALKSCFPNATVLIVHHSGHGDKDRGRGSSVLKGALDCEYKTEKAGDVITLTNTKMKDAAPPETMTFELRSFEKSASLMLTCNISGIKPLAEMPQTALKTFELIDKPIVSKDEWRIAFYESHTGADEAKRKAFGSAIKTLMQGGIVKSDDDGKSYYRPTMPGLIER